MSERATAYEVNHVRVPARWLNFLYRCAQLKGGQVYTITVIVPDKADTEPQWAISAEGKLENGERRSVFLGRSE
jgi:hypothetical protein